MSSRLPETELANWAFLSRANKRDALERHVQPKRIEGTYEPFREILADAVNKQLPLFADNQPTTPWPEIEARISAHRRCRGDNHTLQMNLTVARATHEYALREKITAVPVEITSLAFGVGHLYQFGLSLLMRYPDRVSSVFLDLRRGKGLSSDAREWVFSAQHERYRVAYPDLADIDREIWKYRNNNERSIAAFRAGDVRLTYDELVSDARDTYEVYRQVIDGDRVRKRRSSGGSFGPLFD